MVTGEAKFCHRPVQSRGWLPLPPRPATLCLLFQASFLLFSVDRWSPTNYLPVSPSLPLSLLLSMCLLFSLFHNFCLFFKEYLSTSSLKCFHLLLSTCGSTFVKFCTSSHRCHVIHSKGHEQRRLWDIIPEKLHLHCCVKSSHCHHQKYVRDQAGCDAECED